MVDCRFGILLIVNVDNAISVPLSSNIGRSTLDDIFLNSLFGYLGEYSVLHNGHICLYTKIGLHAATVMRRRRRKKNKNKMRNLICMK